VEKLITLPRPSSYIWGGSLGTGKGRKRKGEWDESGKGKFHTATSFFPVSALEWRVL